jgi:tetratricopeptide (TPR) repeat protein
MYEAGQPQAARRLLEQILAQPDPPIIASLEFMAREGAKSPEAARKYIEAALQRAPRHPGLLNSITRLDLEAGRNKEALARLDEVIGSGQAPPAALLARARILAGQKKFDAAESDVNRVVEAAPNAPGALDLLIQIYAAQNKLGKALESFEEADRAGALSGASRVLMARLYLTQGDRVKARAAFEKALTERTDLASAKNDLAFLLAFDGVELDRALGLAQEAQQAMAEDPNVADTLGFIYFKKGLFEPAAQQAKYAIQLADQANQQQPVFYYHLGLALRSLGQNAEAAQAFEHALAIDQNFPEAASARSELEAAKAGASSTPTS